MIRRALTTDAAAVGHIHVESWSVAYRGIMPDDVIAKTDLPIARGSGPCASPTVNGRCS